MLALRNRKWLILLLALCSVAFVVTAQSSALRLGDSPREALPAGGREVAEFQANALTTTSALMSLNNGGLSPDIGIAGNIVDGSVVPRFSPEFSSGAVHYAIPLIVPPGRAGQQPSVALTYDSQSGNGSAGVGWALNTRSIERSVKQGVNYDQHDFVMREGQMASVLVQTGTSAGFEQYQPQIQDAFIQLSRITTSNSWKLTHKDGSAEIYGESDNSRITVNGRTFGWLLSSVVDTRGNTVFYQYQVLQSEPYLASIAYGGPQTPMMSECKGSMQFNGCVAFRWEQRADSEITYERDGETIRGYRLAGVDLYTRGVRYDGYLLSYAVGNGSPATGRSLLDAVRHTGKGTPDTAEVVASFKYNSVPTAWIRESWASSAFRPQPVLTLHGDFNGDGRTDIAFVPENHTSAWMMYLSAGKSWANGGEPAIWSPGPYQRYPVELVINGHPIDLYMPIPWAGIAADFSGDGQTDIAYSAPNLGCQPTDIGPGQIPFCSPDKWTMFTAGQGGWRTNRLDVWPSGPGVTAYDPIGGGSYDWFSLTSLCHAGRFFNDPRAGLACFDENARQWRVALANDSDWDHKDWVTRTWSGPAPKGNEAPRDWIGQCQFADFNGDRFTDVACQDRDTHNLWHVGLRNGEGWAVVDWSVDASFPMGKGCVAGDINGDGRADIICQHASQEGKWISVLSTGSAFARPQVSDGPTHRDIRFCSSSDLNGDNKTDLICATDNEGVFEYALSQGARFGQLSTWSVGAESGTSLLPKMCSLGDFNGDGAVDAMCVPAAAGKFYMSRLSVPFPDSLIQATDRFGARLTLEYTSSSDYPNKLLTLPIKVLSSWSEQTSPSSGPLTTRIDYKDGLFNIVDQEFLGFGYAKVSDPAKTLEYFYGKPDGTRDLRSRGRVYRALTATTTDRSETLYSYFSSPGASPPFYDPIESTTFSHADCANRSQCAAPSIWQIRFFEHDRLGNPTATLDLREKEPASLLITRDFTPLDETKWEVGFKRSENAASVPNIAGMTAADIHTRAIQQPLTYLTSLAARRDVEVLSATRLTYDTTNVCNAAPGATASLSAIQRLSVDKWDVTSFGYDPWGNLICTGDTLGRITKTSYDTNGVYMQTITAPTGMTTTFNHFDGTEATESSGMPGQLKSSAIGGIIEVKFSYDRFGRMTIFDSSGGHTQRYVYEDTPTNMSSMVRVTDSRGTVTETTYDAAQRPARIRNNAPAGKWIVASIERDLFGNAVAETLPAFEGETASRIRYQYDPLNRLTAVIYPSGDETKLCYMDTSARVLDANGHLKMYATNFRGNVTSVKEFTVAQSECDEAPGTQDSLSFSMVRDPLERVVHMEDSEGVPWNFKYDLQDRLTDLSDAGLNTHFTYDAGGNLVEAQNPDATLVTMTYNKAGQPTEIKASGALDKSVTRFTYDQHGWITQVKGPVSSTSFSYDPVGRLTALDRTTRRFLWFNWRAKVGVSYDEQGRASSITYPQGATYQYSYDSGFLSGVTKQGSTVPLVSFTDFDATGRWSVRKLLSGIIERRSFNNRGWMDSSSLELNGDELMKLTYEYDAVGNPIRSTVDGVETKATFDSLDQLTKLTRAGLSHDFAFNDSKSLLLGDAGSYRYPPPTGAVAESWWGDGYWKTTRNASLWRNGISPAASLNAVVHPHSPVQVAGRAVEHDFSGRVTSALGRQYAYDVKNQLTSIREGGSTTRISYDGLSDLARIDRGFRSSYYFADFFACTSGLCSTGIVGDTGLLAQTNKTGTLFLHRDLLGSVTAVTDQNGSVVWKGVYSPYGKTETSPPSPMVFEGFAYGRTFPNQSAIIKLGARAYDTELGMFLQPDPLLPTSGAAGQVNRFAYANNNPLRFVDPEGLDAFDDPGGTSIWTFGPDFGGGFGFNGNMFANPSFDQNQFNRDLGAFYQQLARVNADRFRNFSGDPSKYIHESHAASVFGVPQVVTEDYVANTLHVPPFARIPEGSLVQNLRAMDRIGVKSAAAADFFWKVLPRGPLGQGAWDYKAGVAKDVSLDKLIATNAGNFNFGAVGAHLGIPLGVLLRTAGLENLTNLTRSQFRKDFFAGRQGIPLFTAPYGDFEGDQYWIVRGYEFYHANADLLNSIMAQSQ